MEIKQLLKNKFLIISSVIAIVFAIGFYNNLDTKTIDIIQQQFEPQQQIKEIESSTRVIKRSLPVLDPKYEELKNEIAKLNSRIDSLNSSSKNAITLQELQKTIKMISPILIPVITFFVGNKKKKKGE